MMSKPGTKRLSPEEIEGLKLGDIIKNLRETKRWSREHLAQEAGISSAAVYKIEQKQMIPTITTLLKVAKAFRKDIKEFLGNINDRGYFLTRANNRFSFTSQEINIGVERISGDLSGKHIEAGILKLKPNATSGKESISHGGEEIHFVLKGKVEYTLGKENIILNKGDSLHFFGNIPHSWKNIGNRDAEILFVITPITSV